MIDETCTWTYDEDADKWDTDCDGAYCFIDGGPEENRYCFCPACGRRIVKLVPVLEQRHCNECGKEWPEDGDPECLYCNSLNTYVVAEGGPPTHPGSERGEAGGAW